MRAPHFQFPALQGREVALPGASRGPVPASARARPARGLVLRLGGVGRLGSRKDLELDVLDRTQLPSSPAIELPLARRGPNALCLGVGQPFRVVVPGSVARGDVVRPFLLVGWDPSHAHPANTAAPRAFPYLAQRSACLEVGLALPPALIRSASSITFLQSETIFKFNRQFSRATRIAKICSARYTVWTGPGRDHAAESDGRSPAQNAHAALLR